MRRARPFLAMALALLLAAPQVRPCAPAPPAGRQVDVVHEEALIVWDAEKHVEHFVRRASFSSDAPDFGFLVPTPTRPELFEAPESVFEALERARAPEVIRRERTVLEPVLLVMLPFLSLRSAPPMTAGRPPVEVLEEKRVAGYDAAVLASTDASALSAWLAEHDYAQRPDLTEWLQPYVEAGHVITAFKIAGGGTRRVGTSPVRMSFATERPFFPYREPADQRRPQRPGLERRLLVHLVAPQRLQGRIGERLPWKATVLYASPRSDLPTLLAGALPKQLLPASGWLTTVADSASPRPGTDDLYFSLAAQQERVVPDPVVVDIRNTIPVPLDLLAALAGLAFWMRRRARRRRASA